MPLYPPTRAPIPFAKIFSVLGIGVIGSFFLVCSGTCVSSILTPEPPPPTIFEVCFGSFGERGVKTWSQLPAAHLQNDREAFCSGAVLEVWSHKNGWPRLLLGFNTEWQPSSHWARHGAVGQVDIMGAHAGQLHARGSYNLRRSGIGHGEYGPFVWWRCDSDRQHCDVVAAADSKDAANETRYRRVLIRRIRDS